MLPSVKRLRSSSTLLYRSLRIRPRPHRSGNFCIRNFVFGKFSKSELLEIGNFRMRSPECNFLNTLRVQIRADSGIRKFLNALDPFFPV